MTKRKSPDEKATTVRKRRQAFNKTKDRATIAKLVINIYHPLAFTNVIQI